MDKGKKKGWEEEDSAAVFWFEIVNKSLESCVCRIQFRFGHRNPFAVSAEENLRNISLSIEILRTHFCKG